MYILRTPRVGDIQDTIGTNPVPIQDKGPPPFLNPGSRAVCLESVGRLISRYLCKEDAHTMAIRTAKGYSVPCECPICSEHGPDQYQGLRDVEEASGISSAPYVLAAHEKRLIEELKCFKTNSMPSKSTGGTVLAALALEKSVKDRKHATPKECARYSIDVDGVVFEEFDPFEYHLIRHISSVEPVHTRCWFPEFRSITPSGGKSQSRFAVSSDGQYMIKSINQKEEEFLRSFGTAFFWYTSQCVLAGIPSLLQPVLGIFSVTSQRGRKRNTCILMLNLTKGSVMDSYRLFDLKGVGPRRRAGSTGSSLRPDTDGDASPRDARIRKAQDAEDREDDQLCSWNPPRHQVDLHVGSRVLLDEDFRLWNNGGSVELEPNSYHFLKCALHNDTLFLSCIQIVDYSLLLAVEIPTDIRTPEIIAGIIDYLRPFTWDKRLESVVKRVNINLTQIGSMLSRGENEESHCELAVAPTIIRPELYARRFRGNIMSLFSSHIV